MEGERQIRRGGREVKRVQGGVAARCIPSETLVFTLLLRGAVRGLLCARTCVDGWWWCWWGGGQ